METAKNPTITFQAITPEQAALDFPGCITADLQESLDYNALEPGYMTLGVRDGKLYACNYEIGWCGWSVWVTEGERLGWNDLDNVDCAFSILLDNSDTEWEESK